MIPVASSNLGDHRDRYDDLADHGDRYDGLISVPGDSSLQTFVLSPTLLHSNNEPFMPGTAFSHFYFLVVAN